MPRKTPAKVGVASMAPRTKDCPSITPETSRVIRDVIDPMNKNITKVARIVFAGAWRAITYRATTIPPTDASPVTIPATNPEIQSPGFVANIGLFTLNS